ncbi:MAG: hypothetical protein R3F29_13745 [Planctomycetota bacterium]
MRKDLAAAAERGSSAMLRRVVAAAICLVAAWLLWGLLVEPFIGWYSGVEQTIPVRAWIDWSLQLFVDVAAIVLAWGIVRGRRAGARDASRS